MARRQHVTLMLGLCLTAFLTLTWFISGNSKPANRFESAGRGHEAFSPNKPDLGAASIIPQDILKGGSIAPSLENATAKAELGRASWRLLHTMMARFPEEPTPDESLALKTFIMLFGRLYPCGECAAHFRKLLEKYPPQVKNRNVAAGWACFVHNEVNKRLKKEEFDCRNIGDFYDCGCGDEDKKKKTSEEMKGREDTKLKKEGLTRGG